MTGLKEYKSLVHFVSKAFFVQRKFWFPLVVMCSVNSSVFSNGGVGVHVERGLLLDRSAFLAGLNTYSMIGLKYKFPAERHNTFEEGVSINHYFFADNRLGTPVSVNYWLSIPMLSNKKNRFFLSQSVGVAYGWEVFDIEKKPPNLHFSSKLSLDFSLSLTYQFSILKGMSCSLSTGVRHFSNGALKRPNHGLNSVFGNVALRYTLDRGGSNGLESSDGVASEKTKKNRFVIGLGNKQPLFFSEGQDSLSEYQEINYWLFTLQYSIHMHLTKGNSLYGGIDFSYDPTADLLPLFDAQGELTDVTIGGFLESVKLGLLIGYAKTLGHLELNVAQGVYVKGTVADASSKLYQRLGLRYQFTKALGLGFAVRSASLGSSDWLEFSISYDW